MSSTSRVSERHEGQERRPGLVTILVPARNEEGNVARLREELGRALDAVPHQFEVIVIDNDSSDGTGDLVKAICRQDSRWRYVRLSRDFGAEASISAGYDLARGDAVIVLYSDLQDPPSLIPEFIARWEEGFDVVYGVQSERSGEPRLNTWVVRRAYRLISRVSDVPIPPDASDFRLVSRPVVDALASLPERSRYLRGMIAWLGFRQVGVPYERRPRTAGESKSSRRFLLRFLINAITSFSLGPLRLAGLVSVALCSVTAVWAIVTVVLALSGHGPSTATLLALLIVALAAVNSVLVWALSEYVGRIHVESRRRPVYVIAETVNMVPAAARTSSDQPALGGVEAGR